KEMGKAGVAFSALIDIGRIGLSVYSLYVKSMLGSSPGYKAHCDISSYITCSKTFNSSYGTGFGLIGPLLGEDHILNQDNGVYGIIFFLMHFLLVCFAASKLGFCLRLLNSLALAAGSLWLAYILFYVLKHACIVCIAIYGLNLLALLLDICQLRCHSAKQKQRVAKAEKKKKK
ncbi:hypothetical protein BOX15_Mlig005345g1, partial [Macrostomum lignano]